MLKLYRRVAHQMTINECFLSYNLQISSSQFLSFVNCAFLLPEMLWYRTDSVYIASFLLQNEDMHVDFGIIF